MVEQKKFGKTKFWIQPGGKRVLLKILALFTEEIFISLHSATDVRKLQSHTARAEEIILTGYIENK